MMSHDADARAGQEAANTASPQGGSDGVVRVPASCMHTLDALWYCYSPVHQAREYYMNGEFDDCRGRLKRFGMCVMSRFRDGQISEAYFEAEEKKTKVVRPPVWELREEYVQRQREQLEQQMRLAREQGGKIDSDGWWL